jgi:hypothetical protein
MDWVARWAWFNLGFSKSSKSTTLMLKSAQLNARFLDLLPPVLFTRARVILSVFLPCVLLPVLFGEVEACSEIGGGGIL